MHGEAYEFILSTTGKNKMPEGLVVEIGSRNINGTIRGCFKEPYVATDVAPGPGVDVVADGATYEPPQPAAIVVCCEVLEHARNAPEICANAYRILAPGGVFLVTAAGTGRAPHSAVDGGRLNPGEFYRNVTETDLRAWLADFSECDVTVNPRANDIYAVAWKGKAPKAARK